MAIVVKNLNLAANAGDARDVGLIPEWGRYPGGGRDYPCGKEPSEKQTAPPWRLCVLILINSYSLGSAQCLLDTELW